MFLFWFCLFLVVWFASGLYNKYMKDYNPEIESSYISYLDANNLYGWAMSKPLPYKGFKWIEPKYVESIQNGIGRIYEVDLEYPAE